MFRFRQWLAARVMQILKELHMSRTATQHLTAAVAALALAVADSTKKIAEEVEALKTAHTDGDDAEVDAAATRITDMTTQLQNAVSLANAAVEQVPVDPAPVADPNAPAAATTDPAAAPQA